jgi:hypothetical protein
MADYSAEDLTPSPTLQEDVPAEVPVESPTGGGTILIPVPVGDAGDL